MTFTFQTKHALRKWVMRHKFLVNARAEALIVLSHLRSVPDFLRWLKTIFDADYLEKRTCCDEEALHIAYVTQRPRVREFKLAYAARTCGCRVTLVAPEDIEGDYFDGFREAKNPWQVLMVLDEIKPDVVHLFVGGNNALMFPIVLFSRVPLVYDPYDCMQGMFNPGYEVNWVERLAERVCFTRSDHLCARSLEPLYLRRQYGYQIPPSTYFPEYCWNEPMKRNPRLIRDEEELHVVYCGGVWPEDRYTKEKLGFAQYLEVGRSLAKQRIHLHLYPANPIKQDQFKSYYALYYKEAEKNRFFHIHETVSYTELVEEIRKYDAGMHLNVFGAKERWPDSFSITKAKLQYSSANKIFDYFEAGLPVFIHSGSHISGLIRHYGHPVYVDNIMNARRELLSVMIHLETGNTNKAVLKMHAYRLGKMYEKII